METPTSQGIRLSLVPLRIHARTGSSGLSAPFCPLAFLLSPDQSEGWLVGAVGIELLFNFTKSRVFTVLPTASQMNWSQMELTNTKAPRNPRSAWQMSGNATHQ